MGYAPEATAIRDAFKRLVVAGQQEAAGRSDDMPHIEIERLGNISRNNKILASLGLIPAPGGGEGAGPSNSRQKRTSDDVSGPLEQRTTRSAKTS